MAGPGSRHENTLILFLNGPWWAFILTQLTPVTWGVDRHDRNHVSRYKYKIEAKNKSRTRKLKEKKNIEKNM